MRLSKFIVTAILLLISMPVVSQIRTATTVVPFQMIENAFSGYSESFQLHMDNWNGAYLTSASYMEMDGHRHDFTLLRSRNTSVFPVFDGEVRIYLNNARSHADSIPSLSPRSRELRLLAPLEGRGYEVWIESRTGENIIDWFVNAFENEICEGLDLNCEGLLANNIERIRRIQWRNPVVDIRLRYTIVDNSLSISVPDVHLHGNLELRTGNRFLDAQLNAVFPNNLLENAFFPRIENQLRSHLTFLLRSVRDEDGRNLQQKMAADFKRVFEAQRNVRLEAIRSIVPLANGNVLMRFDYSIPTTLVP